MGFAEVVEELNNPDVFFVLESKLKMESLFSLKSFEEWRERAGYNYIYATWSRHTKSGAGYAGVVMFSKGKPEKVDFGIEGGGDAVEGRVITARFKNKIVVGAYSQCSGYTKSKIDLKSNFDNLLEAHLKKVESEKGDKQLILAGDLNVAPRDIDAHKNAFRHMREQKETGETTFDPGCSPKEREAYKRFCGVFEGINAFEALHPGEKGQTWRNIGVDRYGSKEEGQRIDHFIVNKTFLARTDSLRAEKVRVGVGLGSSDHWPLVLSFQKEREVDQIEKAVIALIKDGSYNEAFKPTAVYSVGDKKKKRVVDAIGLPIFGFELSKDRKSIGFQQCFLDTGSPFTIFNPDKGKTIEDDVIFRKFLNQKAENQEVVAMEGVGGGVVRSRETLLFDFKFGALHPQVEVVVLPHHEPTLPKLLLGQNALMGKFHGMLMYPPDRDNLLDLKTAFLINPKIVFKGRGPPVDNSKEVVRVMDFFKEEERADEHESAAFKKVTSKVLLNSAVCSDLLTDDDEFLELEGYAGTVASRRCPVLYAEMKPLSGESWEQAVCVDMASPYSFIHRDLVSEIDPKLIRKTTDFKPIFITEGKEYLEFVELKLRFEVGSFAEKITRFYIVDDLHVGAVVGNAIKGFSFELSGEEEILKLVEEKSMETFSIDLREVDFIDYVPPHAALYSSKDIVLPPYSQNKVSVFSTKSLGEGYVVAPTKIKSLEGVQAAWGVCNEPEWVQMLNPTDKFISLKKNVRVARIFETGEADREGGVLVKQINLLRDKQGKAKVESELERLCKVLKVRPQGEGEVKGAVTVKSPEDTRMSESNKNSPEDRQKKQHSSVCDSSISTNIHKDDTHDTSILVSEVTKM